jgi:hypothetical protein
VTDFAGDLELGFELVDETHVLVGLADDVLEGIALVGGGVGDAVDDAGGAFAERVDNAVAEEGLRDRLAVGR